MASTVNHWAFLTPLLLILLGSAGVFSPAVSALTPIPSPSGRGEFGFLPLLAGEGGQGRVRAAEAPLLIVYEDPNAPLIAIEIWIRAGVANETPETSGVAHLLEHMVFKGTDQHPPGMLDATFERAGGMLLATTERDWTRYYASVLPERWQEPLKILLAHLLAPAIPEAELEKERRLILQSEYALHFADPIRPLRYRAFERAFPNHPYGLPLLGDPTVLARLDRQAILEFHRQHYRPNNMVIVVVGKVSKEAVQKVVEQALTPDPFPSGRGEFGSPDKGTAFSFTFGMNARVFQRFQPSPPAPFLFSPHPRPLSHWERGVWLPPSPYGRGRSGVGEGLSRRREKGFRSEPCTRALEGEPRLCTLTPAPSPSGRGEFGSLPVDGEGWGGAELYPPPAGSPRQRGEPRKALTPVPSPSGRGELKGHVFKAFLAPPASQVEAMLATELIRTVLAEPYLGLLYHGDSPLPFGKVISEYSPRLQAGLLIFYFLPPVDAHPEWQQHLEERWERAVSALVEGKAQSLIEQAKEWLTFRHQITLANPLERARLYGLYAVLHLPTLPEEYPQRLRALSPEQVSAFARQLLRPSEESSASQAHPLLQETATVSKPSATTPKNGEGGRTPVRTPPAPHLPVRQRLANGLRVIALRTPEQPMVVVQVLVGASVQEEFPVGTSELTARLLFTTSQNETDETMGLRIAQSGGSLRVEWEPIGARVIAYTRRAFLSSMLSLLAEGLFRAIFEPALLERARQQALWERRWMEGTQEWRLFRTLGVPYADSEDLQKVSLSDIQRYYNLAYRPENLVIVIAGDLPVERMIEEVAKFFGGEWFTKERALPSRHTESEGIAFARHGVIETGQGVSYWGYVQKTAVGTPEEYARLLLNHTARTGGKATPLFQLFRERRGMGYGVGEMNLLGVGYLLSGGFVQGGTLSQQERESIPQVLAELKDTPISPEQRERAYAYLVGNWHRNRLSIVEYCYRLGLAELSGLGYEAEANLPALLERALQEAQ